MAGGEDELIIALKSAKVTKPVTVDPAAQARQVEVRQHVAHGLQLANKGQYAEAEREYRAASQLDPQNDSGYVNLSYVLTQQKKWDEAESAVREALRLNPDNATAHNNLGTIFDNRGDHERALAEYREAIRLDPDCEMAHANVGAALVAKGDLDSGISEEREALRVDPNLAMGHAVLGMGLGQKGDWDGAITEEREALRLEPNNVRAHVALGIALLQKGQRDAAMTEEREALRVDPDNAMAHFSLGAALELKGDRQGALEEYRTAFALAPQNADIKKAYDRLSQPLPPVSKAVPGAALFVAYRTKRHQQSSTAEVFGNIADQIALFLKSHNVALVNDATGVTILTESAPSVYNLVSRVGSAGGGSLILLTVDRPIHSWVKLQIQSYDTSGQLLWEESTADSGQTHRGAAGVRNAIEKMEERLAPRIGQAGMPIK